MAGNESSPSVHLSPQPSWTTAENMSGVRGRYRAHPGHCKSPGLKRHPDSQPRAQICSFLTIVLHLSSEPDPRKGRHLVAHSQPAATGTWSREKQRVLWETLWRPLCMWKTKEPTQDDKRHPQEPEPSTRHPPSLLGFQGPPSFAHAPAENRLAPRD